MLFAAMGGSGRVMGVESFVMAVFVVAGWTSSTRVSS
jgi:hypothetical protein